MQRNVKECLKYVYSSVVAINIENQEELKRGIKKVRCAAERETKRSNLI